MTDVKNNTINNDINTDESAHPIIHELECKACGRCIVACPKKVLHLGKKLNQRGYRYVEYAGQGCVGCTNCFYTCPEPSAIEVVIPVKAKK